MPHLLRLVHPLLRLIERPARRHLFILDVTIKPLPPHCLIRVFLSVLAGLWSLLRICLIGSLRAKIVLKLCGSEAPGLRTTHCALALNHIACFHSVLHVVGQRVLGRQGLAARRIPREHVQDRVRLRLVRVPIIFRLLVLTAWPCHADRFNRLNHRLARGLLQVNRVEQAALLSLAECGGDLRFWHGFRRAGDLSRTHQRRGWLRAAYDDP